MRFRCRQYDKDMQVIYPSFLQSTSTNFCNLLKAYEYANFGTSTIFAEWRCRLSTNYQHQIISLYYLVSKKMHYFLPGNVFIGGNSTFIAFYRAKKHEAWMSVPNKAILKFCLPVGRYRNRSQKTKGVSGFFNFIFCIYNTHTDGLHHGNRHF